MLLMLRRIVYPSTSTSPFNIFRTTMSSSSSSGSLLQTVKSGLQLACHVQPGSKVEEIKVIDSVLHIKTSAQPKDNEANTEVIKIVSDLFGTAKSNVTIVRGHKDRNKIVLVSGLSLEKAKAAIDKLQ